MKKQNRVRKTEKTRWNRECRILLCKKICPSSLTHLFLAVEAVPGVAWPAGAVEASECVGARREQGAGPVLWGWGRCKNKQM